MAGFLAHLVQRWRGPSVEDEEEAEIPEEFVDPISFAAMQDPVLLCGTGQVYCLNSLGAWLAMGSRTCPKTNMVMRDVEVVRLPSLRSRIVAWHEAHGLPPLPPLDPPPEVMREAGADVAALMPELRCGDVYRRGLAAGRINDLFIVWGQQEPMLARQQVMESMLLDLVWMMRQGDTFGSGVAAAALAQYDSPEQMAFLAAVAAMPAVALLWSPHSYTQHSAARLLSKLVRVTPQMPSVLVEAGAVGGLLRQLDLRLPFKYSRCSAASTLWGLCRWRPGGDEVRAGDGVRLLKELALQEEPPTVPDPGRDAYFTRYDKRDAAGCLLELRLTEEEAARPPAITLSQLRIYKHCSHGWLLGQADRATEGYTEEQVEAGVPRIAAGELQEGWQEDEWEPPEHEEGEDAQGQEAVGERERQEGGEQREAGGGGGEEEQEDGYESSDLEGPEELPRQGQERQDRDRPVEQEQQEGGGGREVAALAADVPR